MDIGELEELWDVKSFEDSDIDSEGNRADAEEDPNSHSSDCDNDPDDDGEGDADYVENEDAVQDRVLTNEDKLVDDDIALYITTDNEQFRPGDASGEFSFCDSIVMKSDPANQTKIVTMKHHIKEDLKKKASLAKEAKTF